MLQRWSIDRKHWAMHRWLGITRKRWTIDSRLLIAVSVGPCIFEYASAAAWWDCLPGQAYPNVYPSPLARMKASASARSRSISSGVRGVRSHES